MVFKKRHSMRSNKFTSLLMLFSILGANFISVCPAGQNHTVKTHLSMTSCTAHECNQTETAHSCDQECDHGLCNDKSIMESYNTRHQDKVYSCMPAAPVVSADFVLSVNYTQIAGSCFSFHVPFPRLRTPLRI